MRNILCFGDSNTFGFSPDWVKGNYGRLDRTVRWTGRLQEMLGDEYRIIEEGLSGRTTVFEDPTMPDMNGLAYFQPCLKSHIPLDLVIIMLGTNDTKDMFHARPVEISMGLGRLIRIAKDPTIYMGMPVPQILVAVPVPIGEAALSLPDGLTSPEMIEKSRALAPEYRKTAQMYGCHFIDLGEYAQTSDYEGVHLDAEGHRAVAEAFAAKIREIFG